VVGTPSRELVVVTRNTRDFKDFEGVETANWHDAPGL